MKKLLLLASLLSLFLFVGLASATTCTQAGYKYCAEDTYNYHSASAHSKIYWQFEDDVGVISPNAQATGNLYIKAGYEGSIGGFVIYNEDNWDHIDSGIDCDDYGCTTNFGIKIPSNGGRMKVASAGETFTQCTVLIAADYDSNDDEWAWNWVGVGFPGTGNCISIKVVAPCVPSCSCASSTLIGKTCSNGCGGTCPGTASCITGEEKCEGTTYFGCSNYNWINNGIVKDKCNATCSVNDDCKFYQACTNGTCVQGPINYTIIIIGGVVLIIIVGLVIKFTRRKNGGKRK